MGKSMDRHRIANKYRDELHAISGDGATTASQVLSALSTASSAGGELAAKYKADKEAAAKEKAQKEAQAAAEAKRAEAMHAAIEAEGKPPNDPAVVKARKLDLEARMLEAKAGGGSAWNPAAAQPSKPFTMPWWGWGLIGVGTLGAGVVTYKLVSGGHGRRAR